MFVINAKNNINQIPLVTKTSKKIQSPTSTPTPKALDKSKLSITIQNGSGEAGVASKGSDLLKGLGYNISATGNADNYDYEGVTIKVKSSASAYLPILKKDLSASYTVAASSSDLDNSFSSDAVVIIGK
jgi:hypothetical protein